MAVAIVSAGSAYTVSTVSAAPVANSDAFAILGHVTMVLTDNESGMITEYRQSDNVVVNDGLQLMLDLTFGEAISGNLNGVTDTTVDFMALGNVTSPTAANVADTGLETEVSACSRIGLTDSGGGSGQTISVKATFDASIDNDCAETITELGLFTASTAGGSDQLFARQASFSPITLSITDSLAVTWTVGLADDETGN